VSETERFYIYDTLQQHIDYIHGQIVIENTPTVNVMTAARAVSIERK